MEVEYVLRPDDIMAFHDYFWDHPPKGVGPGRPLLSWSLLVLLGILSLLYAPSLFRGDRSFVAIYCPVVFVLLLVAKLFRRPLLRRQVRRNLEQKADKNAKLLGWKRLTLTPEALIAASEQSTTTLAWTMIEKIVIVGEGALMLDSPSSAYIVPRRAFTDEGEFRAFVTMARRYRHTARQAQSEERLSDREPPEVNTNIMRDKPTDS